ncbi:phage holin family protein [Polycladomyces sp. WAk]|uniref:Phage holin family protein n=1 Tax=Polycladomyces zharkentensis TaxID=2807616 RepID=A0ABS2WMR0_9BACL|nr:phage holin family protein [Polycladomyces sp. WAk]MBN2910763.1 phage holin family protein [Polycladomyces sp. WAk]
METTFKLIVAIGGAAASFLWGGWSTALQTLLLFVALDYLTGFLAAGKEGKLSSRIGFQGITMKVGIFAIVAVAHQVDAMLGDGHIFRDGATAFYIANEALSIIENAGRMGLPIPPKIQQAVEILRGKEIDKK